MRLLFSLCLYVSLFQFLFLNVVAAEQAERGLVYVVPLKGEITEAQFVFLRRVLKIAEERKASAFVIDMDTPGGALEAAVHIVDLLLKTTIPTYTYVNTNAGSAGALIALGTRFIYMAPVSAIGAAAPVLSTGGDVPQTMSEKVISYYSGYFRSAAEQMGHNPEVARAFIDKNQEVKIGKEVINPEGKLLTLSAQEAAQKYDGKPLLATGIAKSVEELVQEAKLPDAIDYMEPSGFEVLAQWITRLAPLFLLGGIVGAYLEFKSPGFGVPGVISAICFLLFFAGHYIAGLTGFETIVVFMIGILLIVVELIFFPGMMVFSVLGVLCMLGSLLFAMMDFWPSRPFEVSGEMLMWPVLNLAIAVGLAAIAISLLARYLPSVPWFSKLLLHTQSPSGPSILTPTDTRLLQPRICVGDEGVSLSNLRPSGRARFGEVETDVTTAGEFIPKGEKIRVTKLEGGAIFVTMMLDQSAK